jgi:hypothetical protein
MVEVMVGCDANCRERAIRDVSVRPRTKQRARAARPDGTLLIV